MTTPEMAMYRP